MDNGTGRSTPNARATANSGGTAAILDRIRQAYVSLTRAERRVADVVLANPVGFARIPIKAISNNAEVSAPTVMRFCRAVGFDGLTSFKLAMVASLAQERPDSHARHTALPRSTAEVLLERTMQMLSRLRQMLHGEAIEQAVRLLAVAHSIQCHASASIAPASDYARSCLIRHGVSATVGTMSDRQAEILELHKPSNTCLIFCYGALTAEQIEMISWRARLDCPTIVISNIPLPPTLRPSVQILFENGNHDAQMYSASTALMAHILIVDVLAAHSFPVLSG